MDGVKPGFAYLELFKMNNHFFIGWNPNAMEAYLKKTYEYDNDCSRKSGSVFEISSDQ